MPSLHACHLQEFRAQNIGLSATLTCVLHPHDHSQETFTPHSQHTDANGVVNSVRPTGRHDKQQQRDATDAHCKRKLVEQQQHLTSSRTRHWTRKPTRLQDQPATEHCITWMLRTCSKCMTLLYDHDLMSCMHVCIFVCTYVFITQCSYAEAYSKYYVY